MHPVTNPQTLSKAGQEMHQEILDQGRAMGNHDIAQNLKKEGQKLKKNRSLEKNLNLKKIYLKLNLKKVTRNLGKESLYLEINHDPLNIVHDLKKKDRN